MLGDFIAGSLRELNYNESREEQENPRKVQLFSNLFIRDHGCAPIEEFHQLL